MATQIKITQLTDIGSANLSVTTLLPVVNMAGVPTTQKTTLGNLANVILSQSGGNYAAVGTANIAYSVANAAQPNITSVGTLTNVVVSGNANVGILKVSGTSNLGAVGNVTITGGSNGQVLTTNGSNVLSWTTVSGGGNGTPGGNTTEIQFNDAGAFAGNTGFTFNNTTGTLAAPFADVSGVANIVGGGATVATKSLLNVASTFGSNSASDPASAQAIRGRVTGSNLAQTRNYVTGVTGQYLVTGTNASEFIKAGVLGVVGDQTTTADGAVVAYLDGDGGLTTANAAYAVSMKNSTPNSGFNYGLDLQFIDLNLGGVTTSTFKQADIRFNNGVKLVANTAGNISINGNLMTSAEVVASGVIQSGTGLTTGGYLSVDGNTDLHNTTVTGNLSATGNITATNLGNISSVDLDGNVSNLLTGNGTYVAIPVVPTVGNIATLNLDGNVSNLLTGNGTYVAIPVVPTVGNIATINLTGSNSNVLYGNGVFAAVAGGANTGNVTFDDINVIGTGNLHLQPDPANAGAYLDIYLTAGPDIHIAGNGETVILGTDNFANVAVNVNGNVSIQAGDANGTHTWNFDTTGNLILAGGNSVIQSIANSSSEPLYPNVSTMVFTPDALLSSQSLVLDPTGPSHIHLRAPGANIDEPDANIFLGGEASSFEVGYYNGNVPNLYIHSNNNTWMFDTTGNLTLPLGSIVYETNIPDGALSGSAIALKPIGGTTANQQLLIYPTAADGDHIHMTSGNLYATELFLGSDNLYVKLANTGNVVINSNDGNSNTAMWTFDTAGNLTLPGNTFAVNYANGTQVSIGGGGNANTGNVTFSDQILIGTGSNDGSGGLYLAPGNASIANSAVQYLRVRGGDVATHIHLDTGNNQFYDQYFGDDAKYVKLANTGNVVIGTDDANGNQYSWSFGTDGNLTTPSNLVIGTGAGSGSRIFQYDDGLEIVGEGANSVVLMGWTANISAPDSVATIAMNYPSGGEGNILFAVGNNATTVNYWLFDNTGNLTVPGSLINDTSIVLSAPAVFNICTIATAGSGYNTGSSLKATTGGSGTGMTVGIGYGLSNQLTSVSVVNPGTGYVNGDVITVSEGTGGTFVITKYNVLANQTNNNTVQTNLTFANNTLTLPIYGEIASNANMTLTTNYSNAGNTSSWTFDTTGNLTLPDTTTINATVSITLEANDTGNITGLNVIGDSHANLYAHGNITLYANTGGAGSTWTFDNSGNLTLPGNTFAVNYANGTQVPVGVTQDITSNGAMSIMLYDGNIKYNNYATVEPSTGNIAGGNISTTGAVTANIANITTGNITTINSGLLQNGNSNITITSNGNVSIQAAGSNVELVVTSTGANVTGTFNATGNVTGSYLISAHASGDEGGEISLAQPPNGNLSGGITIDAYQNTLRMFEQGGTARGLSIDIANSPAGGGTAIGYRDIPQVAAGNVTLAATDAGKHYYSTTAGNLTLTIPLNSTVPFTTGTAISIVVQAAGNVLVNAASGVTLYMAGNSTAANRVVGGYGMATLMKVATNTWFINGAGVA